MQTKSYTLKQTFDADPAAVFHAILDVRGWWSGEIDGRADEVGAEFRYRYGELHDSTQRVTELVPGRKVVWRVLDAHLTFVDDASEWKGTDIVFELAPQGVRGAKTELTFTHVGLMPACECYDACTGGWTALLTGNLQNRVATGKPQPDAFARGPRE